MFGGIDEQYLVYRYSRNVLSAYSFAFAPVNVKRRGTRLNHIDLDFQEATHLRLPEKSSQALSSTLQSYH